MSVIPVSLIFSIVYSRMGLSIIRIRGFGVSRVKGINRVPFPPAIIIACIFPPVTTLLVYVFASELYFFMFNM